ncbi:hypothetical protein B0H11DRAFT_2096366 [Mycena galericulata]|nr:hypothetical protein B0H11DRAFT_2096366 [Mycena galericulata]
MNGCVQCDGHFRYTRPPDRRRATISILHQNPVLSSARSTVPRTRSASPSGTLGGLLELLLLELALLLQTHGLNFRRINCGSRALRGLPVLGIALPLLSTTPCAVTANNRVPTLLNVGLADQNHSLGRRRSDVDIASLHVNQGGDAALRNEVEAAALVVVRAPMIATAVTGIVGKGELEVAGRLEGDELLINGRVIAVLVVFGVHLDRFHGLDSFVTVRIDEDHGLAILAAHNRVGTIKIRILGRYVARRDDSAVTGVVSSHRNSSK